jgi:hypothetical protein
LKLSLLFLITLNALLFGLARGWFGVDPALWISPAQHEAERVSLQLLPEKLEVLRVDASGTTVISSRAVRKSSSSGHGPVIACLRLGAMATEDASALAARLIGVLPPDVELPQSRSVQAAPAFLVHLPPLASEPEAQRKLNELLGKGLAEASVIKDEGALRNGIAFGVFGDEDAARIKQASLMGAGVKALVVARAGPLLAALELRDLPTSARKEVERVSADANAGAWLDCTATPGGTTGTKPQHSGSVPSTGAAPAPASGAS